MRPGLSGAGTHARGVLRFVDEPAEQVRGTMSPQSAPAFSLRYTAVTCAARIPDWRVDLPLLAAGLML
jgi:hypothetical protein